MLLNFFPMRTPPLLLGAALLFWGWQTGFLIVGAAMGVALEASRLVKARWEFSDVELRRIWIFCSLAFLATLIYVFTANDGPASFGGMLTHPSLSAERSAGNASSRAAMSVLRWSPMIFFLFVAAQAYSTREVIPLSTISFFLWRRRKNAVKAGRPLPFDRKINLSHPFFAVCLLAASLHTNEIPGYFWWFCALIAWALWLHRSRLVGVVVWLATLSVAVVLGFSGQSGLNRFQQFVTSYGMQWLGQFLHRGIDPTKTQTAMGQIGRLNRSGKIVIRLETKPGENPPSLLREASYRNYKSAMWFAGVQKEDFEDINVETNGTSWLLIRNKTNTSSVNIACYLPGRKGLLPLPTGSGRLYDLDVFPLRTNAVGAVWAEGPGLAIFDAHYGPGATIDSPPVTNDLRIAEKELPAIQAVMPELQIRGESDAEKLLKVRAFFADRFRYSVWQGPPKLTSTNQTALSRFLLETRSGHCEYFATATVLLLRELKIPARYAIGYAVHEKSGANKYAVRQRDGHAWCLVWDKETKTWVDFDTTPASFIAEEEKRASMFQFLSDAWSRFRFEISKFRWGHGHIRQYILWALVPVLALLFYQIIFRKSWRRRAGKSAGGNIHDDWPGLDSEFYQLERKLKEFIGARRPGETPAKWLERAATEPALMAVKDSLRELLNLHYRHRFDPLGLSPVERAALKQAVTGCLQNLAGVK